jgi:hypothetical protein
MQFHMKTERRRESYEREKQRTERKQESSPEDLEREKKGEKREEEQVGRYSQQPFPHTRMPVLRTAYV